MHSLIVISSVHPGAAAQNDDGMAGLTASLWLSFHLSTQRWGRGGTHGGWGKQNSGDVRSKSSICCTDFLGEISASVWEG